MQVPKPTSLSLLDRHLPVHRQLHFDISAEDENECIYILASLMEDSAVYHALMESSASHVISAKNNNLNTSPSSSSETIAIPSSVSSKQQYTKQPKKKSKSKKNADSCFIPPPPPSKKGGILKRRKQKRPSFAAHLDTKDLRHAEKVLATAGLDCGTVVNLISNHVDKYQVQKETGFSHNYIMALQRKVLRSATGLQLCAPEKHIIGGHTVHVLFDDSSNSILLLRKELFTVLNMSGTSFSYWRKRAGVDEVDTSMDFRLMDLCRSIFGGRATYTLYTAQSALAILEKMESSRMKNTFANFHDLKAVILTYVQRQQNQQRE